MPFLDWVNKNQATQASEQAPYRFLRAVSAHGEVDGPNADKLLIQGDNLLALKALLPFYRGQVKCIFIEPPYNTQSAFEHYDDRLEHSLCLSMTYPRLVLLRELLAEHGSIWVTLDDNDAEIEVKVNLFRTTWSTGEVLKVDVESVLRGIPALANFLKPKVFPKAHLANLGHGIEWFVADLGADNVYAWSKEQAGEVSQQMLCTWIHRNGLSLRSAAEALGLSRRMVSFYRTAQKSIPRAIWLACLGWEAPKPKTLPRALLTAKEYALTHA
jgi:hypothetical protein